MTTRDRALLAWEAGSGRGHIVTLGTMADALAPDLACDAALKSIDHAAELAPRCATVFRGPALVHDNRARTGSAAVATATWGEYLADIGFSDPALIARQVSWWQRLMRERDYRIVIADYAPCAMLAARSLDIPTLAVGTGYGIPPCGLKRFPPFLAEHRQCLFDEAEMCRDLNAVLTPIGVQSLGWLPDIYRRSGEIIRTPRLLDPYAADRSAPALAVQSASPGDVSGRDTLFLYLSTGPADGDGVVDAVIESGLPVRAYVPALDAVTTERLAKAGAQIERHPLSPGEIARSAKLLAHSGQPGILTLGLATGIPHIAFPQHLEHLFHARCAARIGVAAIQSPGSRHISKAAAAIRDVFHSGDMAKRALSTAETMRPEFQIDIRKTIRAEVSRVLEARAAS